MVRLEHTVSWTVPLPMRQASAVTVRVPMGVWTPDGITRASMHDALVGVFAGGSYSDPAGPKRALLVLDTQTGKAVLGGAPCMRMLTTPLGPAFAYRNQAPTMMSMLDAFERDALVMREREPAALVLTQLRAGESGLRCVDFPLHPKFPFLMHVEPLRSGDLTVGGCPDESGDKTQCAHLWLRENTPAALVSEADVVALRAAPPQR